MPTEALIVLTADENTLTALPIAKRSSFKLRSERGYAARSSNCQKKPLLIAQRKGIRQLLFHLPREALTIPHGEENTQPARPIANRALAIHIARENTLISLQIAKRSPYQFHSERNKLPFLPIAKRSLYRFYPQRKGIR